MKRLIALILISICVFGSIGCSYKYQLPDSGFCCLADDGQIYELGDHDKQYIINILNGATWLDSIPNCGGDFIFHTKDQEVRYHSECGTFADYTNKKSTTVTKEQQNAINAMLGVLSNETSDPTAITPDNTLSQTPDIDRYIINQDGFCYLVLPISQQKIRIDAELAIYVENINVDKLKAAEQKISQSVSGYSKHTDFFLQLEDQIIYLEIEAIVPITPQDPDNIIGGCGFDHEHKFFKEPITN